MDTNKPLAREGSPCRVLRPQHGLVRSRKPWVMREVYLAGRGARTAATVRSASRANPPCPDLDAGFVRPVGARAVARLA